jgi:hypothetical protein
MDLRQYYKKLHELESKMPESHVLVVSVETGDGGKEGVITEVPRRNACQLILDGRAKRMDPEQEAQYRAQEALKRGEFQRARTASRIQVQLVPNETMNPAPTKSGR